QGDDHLGAALGVVGAALHERPRAAVADGRGDLPAQVEGLAAVGGDVGQDVPLGVDHGHVAAQVTVDVADVLLQAHGLLVQRRLVVPGQLGGAGDGVGDRLGDVAG